MLVTVTDSVQYADDRWLLAPTIVACAKEVVVHGKVQISPDIVLGFPGKPLEHLELGYGTRLFGGKIAPRSLVTGDYVTIHDGVWCFGREDVTIGHNSWFGASCVIDAEGQWSCGNNFGAGDKSQMWSHIAHGNRLAGCKYYSFGNFEAEDDVWLVGRCTASPGLYRRYSVAMVGSNLTKGMGINEIWGGNPAKNLTDKLGRPYEGQPWEAREELFFRTAELWLKGKEFDPEARESFLARFDPRSSTYFPEYTELEESFMRHLIAHKLRFVPSV